MRRPLVAGNWKMNTGRAEAVRLAGRIAAEVGGSETTEVIVAPPFVWLDAVAAALEGSTVTLAAQDAWHEPPGAVTGEVALAMLLEIGCGAVILGHSERRHVIGEGDGLIGLKVQAAVTAGLQVLFCVGETLEQRESGETEAVLDRQLAAGLDQISAGGMASLVVAYEPVWAIGTGLTATPEQADSAHAHLRNQLVNRYNPEVGQATRILYGGSVTPANAAELMARSDVDGALVGGASLAADSFIAIVEATQAA